MRVEEGGAAVDIFDALIVEIFLVDAVQALDVVCALPAEGCPVEGGCFLEGEAVGACFTHCFGEGRGVPGDFLGDASGGVSVDSVYRWCWRSDLLRLLMELRETYPTLTHVPPNLLLSIVMALAPCWAARRAEATPPEPPPMTK